MTNLISPEDSAADNEFLQLAQSLKYSSAHGAHLAELRPGLFAVYDYAARPIYVGEWDGVLEAFNNRPVYKHNPVPRSPQGGSRKSAGKISAAERAANTARLLASLSQS